MLCLHLWYQRVALNDPTLWLCACTRRVRRCCRRTPACRVLISSQTSSPRTAWWRSSRLWPKTPRWWSLRSTTRLVRGDLMFLSGPGVTFLKMFWDLFCERAASPSSLPCRGRSWETRSRWRSPPCWRTTPASSNSATTSPSRVPVPEPPWPSRETTTWVRDARKIFTPT